MLGLALLLPFDTSKALDPLGVAFACGAAACRALYVVSARKVSSPLGSRAAARSMLVAALIALPFGVARAGTAMFAPRHRRDRASRRRPVQRDAVPDRDRRNKLPHGERRRPEPRRGPRRRRSRRVPSSWRAPPASSMAGHPLHHRGVGRQRPGIARDDPDRHRREVATA